MVGYELSSNTPLKFHGILSEVKHIKRLPSWHYYLEVRPQVFEIFFAIYFYLEPGIIAEHLQRRSRRLGASVWGECTFGTRIEIVPCAGFTVLKSLVDLYQMRCYTPKRLYLRSGDAREVPTIGGSDVVMIGPRSRSEITFRLPGRGMTASPLLLRQWVEIYISRRRRTTTPDVDNHSWRKQRKRQQTLPTKKWTTLCDIFSRLSGESFWREETSIPIKNINKFSYKVELNSLDASLLGDTEHLPSRPTFLEIRALLIALGCTKQAMVRFRQQKKVTNLPAYSRTSTCLKLYPQSITY